MKRYTPAPPKKPKTPSTPEEIAATKAAILKNMRSNRKRPSPADKGQEE